MIPFVSLGFSGLQIQKEKDSSGVSYALNSGNECANDNSCSEEHDPSFGMACLDKFDGPSMVSTNQNSIVKKNAMESADIERYENSCNINVAEKRQETMLGSTQTQKLGLFTLQHMLYSKGNRQLIENEHLLSFLDCLCWHVNPADGGLLNAELRKYWPPKPPSLSVICKSSLSFIYGFETALKMWQLYHRKWIEQKWNFYRVLQSLPQVTNIWMILLILSIFSEGKIQTVS